jgi:hypothetical protein
VKPSAYQNIHYSMEEIESMFIIYLLLDMGVTHGTSGAG